MYSTILCVVCYTTLQYLCSLSYPTDSFASLVLHTLPLSVLGYPTIRCPVSAFCPKMLFHILSWHPNICPFQKWLILPYSFLFCLIPSCSILLFWPSVLCWLGAVLPCPCCPIVPCYSVHFFLPVTSLPAWSSWWCWPCAAPRPSSRTPRRSQGGIPEWRYRHSDGGSHQYS